MYLISYMSLVFIEYLSGRTKFRPCSVESGCPKGVVEPKNGRLVVSSPRVPSVPSMNSVSDCYGKCGVLLRGTTVARHMSYLCIPYVRPLAFKLAGP